MALCDNIFWFSCQLHNLPQWHSIAVPNIYEAISINSNFFLVDEHMGGFLLFLTMEKNLILFKSYNRITNNPPINALSFFWKWV